ncbi:MAG: hypothetical protein IJS15_11120, partial [Victivallales bacterium]|nr:hypothetical protein [Victivallales bacterium]
MIATLNYRRGRRFDAAAEVPRKGRILRRIRVISETVNTSKCVFGIIRTMRRILVYFWLMFALQSAIAVGVDVSGDSAKACPMPGGPFVNEERARVREDRLRALEEARRPLIYDLPPGSEFELFGYVMGQVYQPAPSGHVVVYGDRVNRYIPTYPLPKKFHGMDDLSCQLTPISRRLYSMSLSRRDFSGRANLMSEGVAVLESLGEMLGHELAPFKYEAPDPPYWPCGDWSGPLPDLFVADENQWATSKNVFAVSNTRIGGVLVSVKLEVVSFDRFNMSIAARDDALASESQREFEEDFKKHHEGKTFAEWSQECSFKRSPAYKKNQNRAPLPDDFKIAGHFLGELIPPVEFAERFGKSVFYVRETNTRLSEKFLGVFSRIGIVTNSIGRVSRIV